MGIEGVALKNHGDLSSPRWQVIHHFAADQQLASAGCLEARDHPKQRSLAATRGAEEHEKLTVFGEQVNAVHSGDVAVVFLDPACFYSGHGISSVFEVKRGAGTWLQ